MVCILPDITKNEITGLINDKTALYLGRF